MRIKSILIILLACHFISVLPTMAQSEPDVCLVIGQDADPVAGRTHFKKALEQWIRGQKKEAIESYEKAIIADHSILRHEDHGLAMALLEKYRNPEVEQSPALLCKRGFLENILIGNLEDSIRLYQKAADEAKDKETAQLALDEAQRLQAQLSYLREWQESVRKANAIARRKDLEDYLSREKIEDIQDQVEDNNAELEELRERLAYLQQQEKEASEQMYSSVQTAARYRRRYYYPGSYRSSAPDPDLNNLPPGNWGSDNVANNNQVANPYASQTSSGASGKTALYRYYVHRGAAKRSQDQLSQIRAEISGVYRQIAQLEKANKEARKELSNEAVK
jgi:hypothetical protein